ncbi:MAG: phosphoribosylformylglycinamidine synthase [Robiginitomaculum sp.]|nr:MAG: phosphoribosylformylglycinamidine synthase [Robiginitomaculum sp.]
MKVIVHIQPRSGVLDPQGKAVAGALQHMGFDDVQEVRQGKIIELVIDETDEEKARQRVTKMCEQLLANTVIEDYSISLEA